MMGRKFIYGLLIASIACVLLCGCAGKSESTINTTSNTTNNEEITVKPVEQDEIILEDENKTLSEETIEEQVIYDENDIKITAKSLDSGISKNLNLIIENNSSQSISVVSDRVSVNGFRVDAMMAETVEVGKNVDTSLHLQAYSLEKCGIDQIAELEFCIDIFVADSADMIDTAENISISTSIKDTYTQPVDDSGEILVELNDVRIVSKGLSESISGPAIVLYIENNSEENIVVEVYDVYVNGLRIDPMMYTDVVAGKKAISEIQFYSIDLEENSITDISDVEFNFSFTRFNPEIEVFSSDLIKLSF